MKSIKGIGRFSFAPPEPIDVRTIPSLLRDRWLGVEYKFGTASGQQGDGGVDRYGTDLHQQRAEGIP